MTRAEAAAAFAAFLRLKLPSRSIALPFDLDGESEEAAAISTCLKNKILSAGSDGSFRPNDPFLWIDLGPSPRLAKHETPAEKSQPIARSAFAQWMYEQYFEHTDMKYYD